MTSEQQPGSGTESKRLDRLAESQRVYLSRRVDLEEEYPRFERERKEWRAYILTLEARIAALEFTIEQGRKS